MSSESPKWIALVVSMLALIISSLSWWEAHRGRMINEAVNRPVLRLSEAKGYQESYEKPFSLRLKVTFKNNGKASANVTNLLVVPSLQWAENCGADFSDMKTDGNVEILPGMEQTYYLTATLKPTCEVGWLLFNVPIIAIYKDAGSSAEYSQRVSANLQVYTRDHALGGAEEEKNSGR